ncbi:MAG: hypothetical protein E7662_02845 [Ruminococcaceae bacterium]|nr:hypothetical protein [Oscillospiraceae bacterium]
MNDSSSNYTEYVVAQKSEGKWRVKRILAVCGYVFFSIFWLGFMVGGLKIWPLGMLTPILTWLLVFLTWRYVAVEYEYTMASGTVTFTHIYGRRSRKQIYECKIKDFTRIAPVSDPYANDYAAKDIEITYDFRGSQNTPDAYFATFTDAKGKKGVIFFEMTNKALKICRFYNPSATVMSTTLRY